MLIAVRKPNIFLGSFKAFMNMIRNPRFEKKKKYILSISMELLNIAILPWNKFATLNARLVKLAF